MKLPLAFIQIPTPIDYRYEYVSRSRSSTPFIRTSCHDRHIALRCMDDIHCPTGSHCYKSIKFPRASGVCVVTYDSQFLIEKLDKIWDT